MDTTQFSTKEIELLKYYNLDKLKTDYSPRILYNTAIELAKIKGEPTGQYFESVKSCLQETVREDINKEIGYLDSLISIPAKEPAKGVR